MKLKEGSFVNIIGRYDEDTWTDKNTGELRTAPVLIVDEIEYCYSGNSDKAEKPGAENSEPPARSSERRRSSAETAVERKKTEETPPSMPGNFTGYEGFGGGTNPFY